MRAVVQRVTRAFVEVDNNAMASIGEGIMVLAGFHVDDTYEDMEYILSKILNLRILDDDKGCMNLSLLETGGELLVVPQFTLFGDARKGRRPSYSSAMPPDKAAAFFSDFIDLCRSEFSTVQSGVFGANMKVSLINSGPVTILLDSRRLF